MTNRILEAPPRAVEMSHANKPLRVTYFEHKQAAQGNEVAHTWTDLCRKLGDPQQFEAKEACPLFRPCTSPGASRARGTQVLQLFAIVADYDSELVSVDDAATRLAAAGVRGLLYTTATHRPDRPRWRVVVPLAHPITADEHASMVDWLNGALGGILAPESWEATRCYFFGRVRGVGFEAREVEGVPLDDVIVAPDFNPIGKPTSTMRAQRTPAAGRVAADDDLDRRIALDRADAETLEELRDALRSIPADDRGTWIEVGLALASFKGTDLEEEAREAWVSWSQSSSAFRDGDERQWDTFATTEATYRKVFTLAAEQGWRNPRAAVLETERERSIRIGREGEHRAPVQRVMSGSEMLEELIFIEEGSRVSFTAEPRYTLPLNEFKAAFAASVDVTKSPSGRKSAVHRAQLWLAHKDRKTVRTQTFAPGRGPICMSPENVTAQNLWAPRAEQAPADWRELTQPFFDHVDYLVPDPQERGRFLDWLAHLEQQPGQLPSTHYLLIAKQTGIGRNWLAYALARAFAGHVALGFDLGEALRSGFNGALSETLLAVVDELHEGAPGSSNRPIAEKLKSMLTEATRRINPKYGRQRVEFNCARFLMFSNHEAALPLADNDRRIVVLENPSERRSADYYARLYALLDAPGFGAALGKALGERDISSFNPGEVAPMSEAKARTIRAGRTEVEQAVRDVAREWPADCITSAKLNVVVSQALGGKTWSVQAFAVAAGLVKYPARVKVGGVAAHVWILRNTAHWMAAIPLAVASEAVRGETEDNSQDFA